MDLARRGAEDAESSNAVLKDVTGAIVDRSLQLHIVLGPGLLETVYEAVLARDLARQGF